MAHLGQTRVLPRGQGSGCYAGLAGTFDSPPHLLRTMLGADLPCNRVLSVLSPCWVRVWHGFRLLLS